MRQSTKDLVLILRQPIRTRCGNGHSVEVVSERCLEAAQRLEALETALRYYGRHDDNCDAVMAWPCSTEIACDCGFRQTVHELCYVSH